MTNVPIKRRNLDKETKKPSWRMSCEVEGRDCGDASPSQRTSKIARKSPEVRRET